MEATLGDQSWLAHIKPTWRSLFTGRETNTCISHFQFDEASLEASKQINDDQRYDQQLFNYYPAPHRDSIVFNATYASNIKDQARHFVLVEVCMLQGSQEAGSAMNHIQGKIYRMDFEHGKSKESSLGFTQERVQSSREISLWTRELHFMWWVVKVSWRQKNKNRFKNRRIHQSLWLQLVRPIPLQKQQFMFVIWTFLLKFNSLIESPAVLSLGKWCE